MRRVLSDREGRQVVLITSPDGSRQIIRRIEVAPDDSGPDLVARAGALGLLRRVQLPGFALVEDRAIIGRTLEIKEQWIDGVSAADVLGEIRQHITVNVALAIAHDVVRGLSILHGVREAGGRSASLIHGRIDLEHLYISPSGDVRVVGFEGLRGEPRTDVRGVLEVLQAFLALRASSPAGKALLSRLGQLHFDSAGQLEAAVGSYLDRLDLQDLATRRGTFAAKLMGSVSGPVPDGQSFDATSLATISSSDLEVISELGVSVLEDDTVNEPVPPGLDDGDTKETSPSALDAAVRKGLMARASTPSRDPLKPQLVFGKYNVVASIGRGGMGEIYLAREVAHGRPGDLVALKVLGDQDEDTEEALGMLMDEAAIMAQIEHENVLKVINFGRAMGQFFLATEYLEGRPLVRVMIDSYAHEGGLAYGAVASIGADSALGLFAAHTTTTSGGEALNVVHRDVSPQNIFVTYAGVSKVIDFGVARASQRISKTEVGLVKGKAAYMSPEQTEGKEVDGRSDVFSLGICLWEMTAGRRLFKRKSEYDTLMAVSTAPIEPPTVVRGSPNPVLDHVILSALARNREKRTQTARELAAQLIEFAAGVGVLDRSQVVSELMHRLFGDVAKREKELIGALEARIATPEEVEKLRELSGVSPTRARGREITLVGEPSGILELDTFGDSEDTADGEVIELHALEPPPGDTGERVLKAVADFHAERAPTNPEEVAAQPQSALMDDAPTRRIPSPDEVIPNLGASRDTPVIFEDGQPAFPHRPNALSDPLDISIDVDDGGFTPLPAEDEELVAQAVSDSEAHAPGVPEKKTRRLALLVFVALLLSVAGFLIWRERSAFRAVLHEIGDLGFVAERQDRLSETATASSTTTVARTERPKRSAPVPPEPATSLVTVQKLLTGLEGVGLEATASEGTYMVADSNGRTIIFDEKAKITELTTGEEKGWLVESSAKSLTTVTWIGRAGDSWHVRGLSINDCPASVRISHSGLVLTYGTTDVALPHGGGELRDVSVAPPRGVKRLLLEPPGLAFGSKDDESTYCKSGWWGKRVVLRRLPLGEYTLRWIGDSRVHTSKLTVGADSVTGGKLLKTRSSPK